MPQQEQPRPIEEVLPSTVHNPGGRMSHQPSPQGQEAQPQRQRQADSGYQVPQRDSRSHLTAIVGLVAILLLALAGTAYASNTWPFNRSQSPSLAQVAPEPGIKIQQAATPAQTPVPAPAQVAQEPNAMATMQAEFAQLRKDAEQARIAAQATITAFQAQQQQNQAIQAAVQATMQAQQAQSKPAATVQVQATAVPAAAVTPGAPTPVSAAQATPVPGQPATVATRCVSKDELLTEFKNLPKSNRPNELLGALNVLWDSSTGEVGEGWVKGPYQVNDLGQGGAVIVFTDLLGQQVKSLDGSPIAASDMVWLRRQGTWGAFVLRKTAVIPTGGRLIYLCSGVSNDDLLGALR